MSIPFFPSFQKFWSDTKGVVTVQMVMFSIMLFGGVGLMMDFGRAYSAHSQMQAFVDQVALAAASELDGKSDAITRATAAANAVSKSSAFIESNSGFQLSSLIFMDDAPTDTSGAYSKTQAATHATTVPEVAKYVKATAATASVSMTLLNFAMDSDSGFDSIDVVASAVATSRTVSCGGLSPIVMCNPFEGDANTSWQEEMKNGIGYRMKLTANNTSGTRPANGSNSLQLGLLKSPDTLMDVRNTICSNINNLPGAASTTKSAETLRDICMLATVETGLSCVNDQVAFKAAEPEAITTGLGVIFDMYDDSMQDIMDVSSDFSFAHNFPATLGLATNITRSSLFYPDIVPVNGRMKRADYMIYLDDVEAQLTADYNQAMATAPFFLRAGITAAYNTNVAAINTERAAYAVDPNIPDESRLNHVYDEGARSQWGPVPVESCLAAENCNTTQGSSYPVIFPNTPGVNDVKAYAAALYRPYLLQQIVNNSGGAYANIWDVPPGMVDATALVGGATSYYQFYSAQERSNAGLHDIVATNGHLGRDNLGNPITPVSGYGMRGTRASAANYSDAYGGIAAVGPEERKVQRVTIVNCDGAETYAAATGDTSATYSDTYMGEVVDVVDVMLLTPPMVQGCATALANDPQNNYLCSNENVTDVDLDVELVDAASINGVNFDARFYAVLVH